MPRHKTPPGYGQGKRGRHKRQHSKETKVWEEELSVPEKPLWMPQEAYDALLRLREGK